MAEFAASGKLSALQRPSLLRQNESMQTSPSNAPTEVTLHDLYPHLTDEQLAEVGERLRDYVATVVSIYEYLENDSRAYARFKALTAANRCSRIHSERSNLTPA